MTRMAGDLRVYAGPQEVAQGLADAFVAAAADAIAARGRFCVALSGGTTPKATYALLAQPSYASAVAWPAVQIFFGDERCVPPDHEQSNYRMAREAFLGPLGLEESQIHRIHGEDDPSAAAAAYRIDLVAALGERPRFDMVMLGMGPDGHTASLFPGSDPTAGDEDLVRAVYSQSQSQWRITITPRVINHARVVVFAAEGAGKAQTLERVRNGPYDPVTYPAQIVAPVDGALIWLVDRAAAGG